MGNFFTRTQERTEFIYNTVEILQQIGIYMKQNNDKPENITVNDIKKLYQRFYYPTHSLTILDELNSDYDILRRKLRENIRAYNKYNSTNINENNYVNNVMENLRPTLDKYIYP